MIRKQNNFGAKYGNEKNITEKLNEKATQEKNEKDSKKERRRKYTSINFEQHSKKYQIGKLQAMMVFMDTGLKSSLSSMTDWLSKWTDAYKKQTYSKGWQKERPLWSIKTSKRNHPQQLQTHNVPTIDVEYSNCTN